MKPIAIELFCGSFGWSAGFAAEGFHCIGFDIEHLPHHGPVPKNCELVIQDVLTIHGSQFKDATILLCSPPCQNYSYLAMPWSRSTDPNNSKAAKALRLKWETEGPDNRLFDACFRIQREAIEAAGRYIPIIVENVRGAQPWVGRSAWNYGSFHLWGDVPALMPINLKRGHKVPGFRFDGSVGSFQSASVKVANGNDRHDGRDDEFIGSVGIDGGRNEHSGAQENGGILVGMGAKGRTGGGWFGDSRHGETRKGDPRDVRKQEDGSWMTPDGTKIGGDWFSDPQSTCRKHGSRSNARKAASAQIAKIPLPLSQYLAQVFKPRAEAAA